MKYLLSTGRTTTNTLTYIRDMITLNMKIRKKGIPYYDGGSDELIPDIMTNNLEKHVKTVVEDVLKRVKEQFPKISVSIEGTIIQNSTITIKVNINGVKDTIDISPKFKEE